MGEYKKPLIVIAGPTACGKTDSSILLAQKIGGEIISADSMQVYKYMDIGTAKIKKDEMKGIEHYLIDEFYPDEEFNVKIFQEKVKNYINLIYEKDKIPILVGGTGFYINAIVYDNNFMLSNGVSYRDNLEKEAQKYGNEYLYNKLKAIDPEYASGVHYNNVKKVIRALEFYYQTGKKLSEHNEEQKKNQSPYNTAFFILNMERETLYERINRRVDIMIENGLVDEVRNLIKMGYSPELVSMQGLGYKEIVPYIQEKTTLDTAIDEIKQKTRHFAKRQLTWFRNKTDGQWLDVTGESPQYICDKMFDYIKYKGVI